MFCRIYILFMCIVVKIVNGIIFWEQKRMNKRINKVLALIPVISIAIFVTIRAAIMGITYDEAFTFLAYSKPLADDTSLWTLKNIWYTCVANNHWMYTIMEAILLKTTGIMYNEFIIRLPAVVFGILYLLIAYFGYVKEKISGITFVLLVFNYYVEEFFSLGRGYGVAATLVLGALIIYKYWVESSYSKTIYLLISTGLLILSAYANSVALVPGFCIGLIAIVQIIWNKKVVTVLKFIPIYPIMVGYGVLGLIIVKYHFNVTKEGMGAYVADKVNLVGLIKEYVGMFFTNDKIIMILSLLLLFVTFAFAVLLLLKKRLLSCDYTLAGFIYFICLLVMIIVFERGGMTGRTLIPAFPLVAFEFGELLDNVLDIYNRSGKKCAVIGCAIILLLSITYISRADLYHVSDWYDDCEVKNLRKTNEYVFNANNASDVFYSEADMNLH